MFDGLFYEPGEMRRVRGDALGNETCSGGDTVADHIQHRVHRRIELQGKKRPLAALQVGSSGTGLALGQRVHEVIDHDTGYVDVSPDCVGKVSCPDAEEVAIAADSHNCELRIGQLGSLGDKHSTAMKAVETIGVYVGRYPRRTADSGRDESPMRRYPQIRQDPPGERIEEGKIAAARTPDRRHLCSIVGVFAHCASSVMGRDSSFLLKARPPALA